MGLENVFLSVLPIVKIAGTIDNLELHDLFSNSRSVQRDGKGKSRPGVTPDG